MDEQNKKRMKIKIRILCGIVVIFVATGIAYAFTLNRYLNQNNHIDENIIPMQTETVETEPATETMVTTETESIPEETQETKTGCTKRTHIQRNLYRKLYRRNGANRIDISV